MSEIKACLAETKHKKMAKTKKNLPIKAKQRKEKWNDIVQSKGVSNH